MFSFGNTNYNLYLCTRQSTLISKVIMSKGIKKDPRRAICDDLQFVINQLRSVKTFVHCGVPERIDALDLLQFLSFCIQRSYDDIKKEFNLEEG